ncbi:sulfate permease [Spizellomyces punctatus DAOM BR117]|uniref:Sulfate permease n=1 Tax=Spizellomyces punctatus (strain DAOM BR117) TaxID=645134 RepID=A0A0L0H533_SPIPD|nr:sulfate permease [Spizellomyces punctatus DAOM BR117]KNC96600.1 sulfate permease [Spizellomyces punctatus DAOM BR117]|eukprot:XP_016604640.1 sulfate permease [Spizellomyces punctatus DAOM BR117]
MPAFHKNSLSPFASAEQDQGLNNDNIGPVSESTPLLDTSVDGFESTDNDKLFGSPVELRRRDGCKDSYSAYYKAFQTRLRYYVPVIGWLPKYNFRRNLQSDLIAGITVAFLLVPQGLSYAQALVKIPPIHGLFTASIPLLVYGFLGTSRQLSLGPEALISILVGATIKEYSASKEPRHGSIPSLGAADPQQEAVEIALVLCLMVGILTFLLGFFRLGFLDSVLSRALLRGFVLAVAMVVMIDMADTLLGISPPSNQCGHGPSKPVDPAPDGESPIQKLFDTLSKLGQAHPLTTILSASSISFLIGMKVLKAKFGKKRWLQVIPEILVLVVVTTILCQVFRWDCQGVAILNVKGSDSAEYRYPKLPTMTLSRIRALMLSAILISVIGFVESIVVAKTYATKHNYSVSPNRELVAIGVSNIVGSILGAYPAFGSLGRSAVNDTAGAKTQMAGFFTGIVVLCTTIWLLPFFQFLPKAVCSSIIVVAALKLVELEDVHFMLRLRAWKDVGLMMITFLTTILLSIESGTLLSVGISLLLVIKHTTKTRLAILGHILVVDPRTGNVKTKYRSIHDSDKVQRIEDALVVRVEEGLFFGNSGQLKDRLKRIEMYGDLGVHPGEEPRRIPATRRRSQSRPEEQAMEEGHSPADDHIRAVVFDFGAVTAIDASATLTLLEIVEDYKHRNMEVCFVKLRESCKHAFLRSGLYDLVGPSHFFRKVRDATEYLKSTDRRRMPQDPNQPESMAPRDIVIPGNGQGASSQQHAQEWTVPNKKGSFAASSYFASYMEDAELERRSGVIIRGEPQSEVEEDIFVTGSDNAGSHTGFAKRFRARSGKIPLGLATLFDERNSVELTTDSEVESPGFGPDAEDTVRSGRVPTDGHV